MAFSWEIWLVDKSLAQIENVVFKKYEATKEIFCSFDKYR